MTQKLTLLLFLVIYTPSKSQINEKTSALETPLPSTDTIFPSIKNLTNERSTSCDCYIQPDITYTEITDSFTSGSFFSTTDDGFYGPISLPFDICFYGNN